MMNKYPPPFLVSAFSPFQKARFFTKPDLRNAYDLIPYPAGGISRCSTGSYFISLLTTFLFFETQEEHIHLVLQYLLENKQYVKDQK